jgi:hypothetical protein
MLNFKKLDERDIPKVGEIWRHSEGGDIYIRIIDTEGQRAIGEESLEVFFSIRLTGLNIGKVCSTLRFRSVEVLI